MGVFSTKTKKMKGMRVFIDIKPNEKEIMDKLNTEPSIQAYIKALIRANIEMERRLKDDKYYINQLKTERLKELQKRSYLKGE